MLCKSMPVAVERLSCLEDQYVSSVAKMNRNATPNQIAVDHAIASVTNVTELKQVCLLAWKPV